MFAFSSVRCIISDRKCHSRNKNSPHKQLLKFPSLPLTPVIFDTNTANGENAVGMRLVLALYWCCLSNVCVFEQNLS